MRQHAQFANFLFFSSIIFYCPLASSCAAPIIIAPMHYAETNNATPTIVWVADKNALTHDIFIDSRIPEGEIIVRQSHSLTSTSFTPLTPLTNRKAVVAVRVQTKCNDKKTSTFSEIAFHINISKTCAPPRLKSQTRNGEMWEVIWEENSKVHKIEGRVFNGSDASPQQITVAVKPPLKIPSSKDQLQTIGIRADCGNSKSSWVWTNNKE